MRMILKYSALFCLSVGIYYYTAAAQSIHDMVEFLDLNTEQLSTYRARSDNRTLVMIYMAADNDLRGFAARNIKQMARIGTNEHVIILVHLDIRLTGNKKVTRRYIIEKDRFIQVNGNDPLTQSMDSGNKQTLISSCQWAITNFPARYYALIFWNHGSGPTDPKHGRPLNTANLLFSFNAASKQFELDRTEGFFDVMEELYSGPRGICWDDSTGNYITNRDMDDALQTVRSRYLNNRKFDLIGFDACFMASSEIADILRKHADFMVGSEDVELGAGWNYEKALAPFEYQNIKPRDFAKHIVSAYHDYYHKITSDYTQSAFDLQFADRLQNNVNAVAEQLLICIDTQLQDSVTKKLRDCRHKKNIVYFSEPSYIDLHHLYQNILHTVDSFVCDQNAKQTLKQLLLQGQSIIKQMVIAHAEGKNVAQAQGVSIYFPEHRPIHSSYADGPFHFPQWIDFLKMYHQL